MIVRRPMVQGMGFTAETCQPWDSPCVERNAVRSAREQAQQIIDRINSDVAACVRDANLQPGDFKSAALAECDRRKAEWLGAPNVQTPDQAEASIVNDWAAQARDVVAGLQAAGQTFIPDAARPANYLAPIAVPTVNAYGVSTAAAPAGSKVINSSGGQSAPATLSDSGGSVPASSWFSSLPWYAWAAGGVVALIALRGGGR